MNQVTSPLRYCPNCKATLRMPAFVIDCDDGCRFWSDGKMDAVGLPALVIYRRCPECLTPFKRGNAPRVAESTPVDAAAPEVRMLDAVAFRQLIDVHIASGDRQEEKAARIEYWLHLNDGLRTGHHRLKPAIGAAWKVEFEDNISRLTYLLDETIPEERIRKAELFRELGQFDQALELLVKLPGKFHWLAGLISMHAASGNSELFGVLKTPGGWQPIPRHLVS